MLFIIHSPENLLSSHIVYNREKQKKLKTNIFVWVIRKGFLQVHTGVKLFQAKDYFAVLSTDNLSWFTDSDVKINQQRKIILVKIFFSHSGKR